jgi:hypothetical protein
MPDRRSNLELEQHVIKTMLYFDIFNYPLNVEEVFRYLHVNSVTKDDVSRALNGLVEKHNVYRFGGFYSLSNQIKIVERRQRGNAEARKLLPLVKKRARLISSFPFVKAVMASGSFSKDYMDENSDLDFFIVTAPGKLWIARTLLALYKRIVFFNSHKYFCINYFVDDSHLEIEEKNLFTATELATLIPLYNEEMYKNLLQANKWLRDFFPNFKPRDFEGIATNLPFFKGMLEKLLIPFAALVENFLMKLTLSRFRRIYEKQYSEMDFKVAFKSKKYASKNHPKHYQRKIMDLYNEKVTDFSNRHEIRWRT